MAPNQKKWKFFLLFVLVVSVTNLVAQDSYKYSVDLTALKDDKLTVELQTPPIKTATATFFFPKIVPGTYRYSNFGKYVHNLKALDRSGKELPVTHSTEDGWEIQNATQLVKVTYQVEDTWDSDIDNKVYTMVGTNFEEGKNFVLNTCGIFGYIDGMKKIPYDISITKPINYYGATGLKAVSTSSTRDVYHSINTDELYDSPIMFSLPDTSTVKVGNADILVSVYSPNKKVNAAFLAQHMQRFLLASKDYLGGKLPVDKYAFIFYFNADQKLKGESGAWEHSYSSFYCLDEEPQESAIDAWVDIAAHEFFHIVTPLTISSREVKEFDFNVPRLSKHLWLYEGSTEYYSHHMQVWTGMKTPKQFLAVLAGEIRYSRANFNDSLPFTELSTESAGKHADQYVNVYMKGALINACLDLYLLQLSGNQYHFKDLKQDLGVRYGAGKFFEDSVLFNVMGELSYPEIKDFMLTYVQGSTPIPYEKFFDLAGVDYIPRETTMAFSLGGIDLNPDADQKVRLGVKSMNDFGKKMGYKEGDELVSLNGITITGTNTTRTINEILGKIKEGEPLIAIVNRKQGKKNSMVTLQAPAEKVQKEILHQVRFNPNATLAQLKLRAAWLGECSAK